MDPKFEIPRWSTRNPLGIIALFISLIYGMSALLLGTSVASLAEYNQTILVLFIVLFPFVVLGVFAWFVANHHKKLYGPGDFRSDEAFHAADDLPPADLGRRLSKEIETADTKADKASSEKAPESGNKVAESQRSPRIASYLGRHAQVARAYMIEGLVFQELQREFGAAVKREVSIGLAEGRRFVADGVLQVGNETVVVEVKFVRNPGALRNVLGNMGYQLTSYRKALERESRNGIKFILAIVFDSEVPSGRAAEAIEEYRRDVGKSLEIRLFPLRDLLVKYGIPLADERERTVGLIGANPETVTEEASGQGSIP